MEAVCVNLSRQNSLVTYKAEKGTFGSVGVPIPRVSQTVKIVVYTGLGAKAPQSIPRAQWKQKKHPTLFFS